MDLSSFPAIEITNSLLGILVSVLTLIGAFSSTKRISKSFNTKWSGNIDIKVGDETEIKDSFK